MKNVLAISLFLFFSCQIQGNEHSSYIDPDASVDTASLDTATFAGGCFWCVEASFEQIEGVIEAVSGYSGGSKENADYKKVSYGRTNHAEAVQIVYDTTIIDFNTLLDIFFVAHDPTQLNRQGPDVGKQYRSEIFYHNPEQKRLAESKIKQLSSSFNNPIVTRISKLEAFYMAEEYHQDYERRNPNQPYVLSVSKPKIDEVARTFKERLKKSYQ